MADKSVTVISLPQMVDLALNSPEVGIVNFTVLHSLLHVIVNQLDMGDCNVEFRGSDSERLQNYISTAKPGPIITLTEYTVGADGKGRKKKIRKHKKQQKDDEKGKKDEKQKEKEIAIIKKEEEGSINEAESSGSMQTIVVVEPASREKIGESPKFTIALTKEQLSKIQKDIKELQTQVKELTDLPSNMGLLDAIKSSRDGSNSPILDMFQILNLVKRLDATDVVMNKMVTLLEDLAVRQSLGGSDKGTTFKEKSHELISQSQEIRKSLENSMGGSNQIQELINKMKSIEDRIVQLERRPVTHRGSKQRSSADSEVFEKPRKHSVVSDSSDKGKQDVNKGNQDVNKGNQDVNKGNQDSNKGNQDTHKGNQDTHKGNQDTHKGNQDSNKGNQDAHKGKPDADKNDNEEEYSDEYEGGGDIENIDLDNTDITTLHVKDAIAVIQREFINMKEYNISNQAGIQALKEIETLKESLLTDDKSKNLPPDVKFGQMEMKINDLKEQVSTMDTIYHQQFANITDQIEQLDNEITALWERISQGLPAGDASAAAGGQNIQELYNKLVQLQDDMDGLAQTASKLLSEREGRQNSLDIMIEQIELLKTVKADREDLEDALADKADACQINRKVSHEQFDAAYDDMSRTLEDTIVQLKRQEELWIQSLNDLQKEIGNKLDKMELTPLKDFINSKLKSIQEKVKKISSLRPENEAAGTKSKLLKNVNCISCDADVVMRRQTDITMFPKPYAMPSNKSPAPYLAYELDLLRKQQKALPNSKNLNVFENALVTGKSKPIDKDHICNRYCGGSHTVTTPQQRVMRVGHFMEQWGPEIAPVNEVMIKGTDGHLYKGRDDAALRASANEKAPTPRIETPALTVNECGPGAAMKEVKCEFKSDTANK